MMISDQPPAVIQDTIVMSMDANTTCRRLGLEAEADQHIYACSGIKRDGSCVIIIDVHLNMQMIDNILKHPTGCEKRTDI